MADLNKIYGKLLRRRREESGLTRADVVKHLDMAYMSLYKLEKGDYNLKVFHVERLLNLYGVKLSQFYNDLKNVCD